MSDHKKTIMVLPILFNTEMVQAILSGQKTVTRRIIKPQPTCVLSEEEATERTLSGEDPYGMHAYPTERDIILKASCQPGDILYVRETWCALPVNEAGHMRGHDIYYYRADGDMRPEGWRGNWHPSIHMPKEAARIFLRVTDVRVERLQDITIDQIEKEGVETEYPYVLNGEERRYAFSQLWNSTIKKTDLTRYGWNANPWVFAIGIERIKKPDVLR